jgi:predicted MPP superfamily phosphohydrolase
VALWLAVLATLLGFLNARRTARVKHVRVPVSGLPAGLEGFTIVQISDIHVGPTIRGPYVQGIVEAVNRLQPDVVAITGDLVDGSVADLGQHVAPLSGLVARHGSYFVTGNHEYYSGALPWIAELGRLGIRVLHNEHVVIHRSGEKLVLAGVPDYSAGHFHADHRSDPGAAIAGAPADAGVKVLLAHQPRSAPAAAQAGFDVQISGHTHGGQFWPWIHFVRFQQPFTAGLHRLDALSVYVSRGTGYWGPPKRFGAPSEITRLMLVAA